MEIANLLGSALDLGVQAMLQVCIKLATRHVCSTYITTKEEKSAKPSKDGKVGICYPLPTASFLFPSFCKWQPRFLCPISSRVPSFLIIVVMVSCPPKICAPLSTVVWEISALGLHFPTPLASTIVLINGHSWPKYLRSLPYAFSFLFCH